MSTRLVPPGLGVSLSRVLREMNPLVMCITNRVTPQRVADILLAVRASPAMIDNAAEVPLFASSSSAVYVNMGLHYSQIAALNALSPSDPPIVVDPVGFGASSYRDAKIHSFLERCPPAAIKGNANEICGLAGATGGAHGRGVDSSAGTAAVIEPAIALSAKYGCVVSITGDHDVIVKAGTARGEQDLVVRVVGDSPMLAAVTGTGCALGGVIAAAVGASAAAGSFNFFPAVVAAHAMYTMAGLRAAARCAGPGSLSIALVDELYAISCGPYAFSPLSELRIEVLSGEFDAGPLLLGGSGSVERSSSGAMKEDRRWQVYLVTDDEWLTEDGGKLLMHKLDAAISGGATAVQLRLKRASTADYLE